VTSRFGSAILTCLLGAAAGVAAGCGSDAQQADASVPQDADFMPCLDTPAVDYMPGITVTSSAPGTYVATLVSAMTEVKAGSPLVDGARVGIDTWVVSVTQAAGGTPAEVTMMAQRPSMPRHGHGATTYPAVTPGDPGMFTVSAINFFMPGYWEQKLDLQPASGDAETVAFAICVVQ
jgi:hypothetical protein